MTQSKKAHEMMFLICFGMLVSNAAAIQDLSGKMFVFPQETNTAHVRLTPEQESFSAVTVCHRSFTELKRTHTLFSLATPSVIDCFITIVQYSNVPLTAFVQNNVARFGGIDYAPNKWHSVCTTWSSTSGLVQAWLNGQPLTIHYVTESVITGKPVVALGQDQDSYGGGFDAKQSFVGMMSDVHMWDYVLSPCEIQKYMEDQRFTPGNVLNWAALDFEIKGRVVVENKQTGCTCFN